MSKQKRANKAMGRARRSDKQNKNDASIQALLHRLEQGPPEVTRMVIEQLSDEPARLAALKFVGRNFWSQTVPILHSSLVLDLEMDAAENLQHLAEMPWLQHVRDLVLQDARERLFCPPRSQYFAILELLSRLTNLQKVVLEISIKYRDSLVSMLDVLSALPKLEKLGVRHVPIFDGIFNEEPQLEDGTAYKEDDHQVIPFRGLQHLSVTDLDEEVLHWLFASMTTSRTHVPCSGNLVSIDLTRGFYPLSTGLALFASHASTLEKIVVEWVDNEDEGPWYDCSVVRLPKLKLLSCTVSQYYHARETMDASATLLHLIDAPALETIGCGYILDGHSAEDCRTLAKGWIQRSPSLKHVLASHFPPDPNVTVVENNIRNTLLKANIQIVEGILEGTSARLLCLGEEEYDEYLDDQMDLVRP